MEPSLDVTDEANKVDMPPPKKRRKPISRPILILIISLTVLLTVAVVTVVLYCSLTSASRTLSALVPSPPDIHLLCNSTRSPDICVSELEKSLPDLKNFTLQDALQISVRISSDHLNNATSLVERLLRSSNQNLTSTAKVCVEVLTNGQSRISSTLDALPRGKLKDARAWMSGALSYQVSCASGLKNIYNQTQWPGGNDTFAVFDTLIGLSSNALSLIVAYDVYGDDTASWRPPQTERNGFWEKAELGGSDPFTGGFPSGLKSNVTVCGGGCDYKKVQEAVDAAPSNSTGNDRFVIYIKEGVYDEIVRVAFEKKNLVFLGDGMGKTVITGSLNVGIMGISTHNSATVGVMGDGFMASGLTIQNTAGVGAQQAVAFRSDSDQSVVENVEFLGNQDTLCPNSLRQFYKSCVIQGNVDFIFGSSAAFFQNCTILVRPRQLNPEKGETNAVTAHGRTDPAMSTGFVFQHCVINGTEGYMELYKNNSAVHKNYLGRPWKEYSRTIFLYCNLEALIDPQGWMPWSGDFALPTLYYGEFGNSGPGSDVSKRVNWSSQVQQLTLLSSG